MDNDAPHCGASPFQAPTKRRQDAESTRGFAMFDPLSRKRSKPSLFAFLGGVLAAAAVALSAYAAHGGADAQTQANLHSAALYAFGHGIALAALAAGTTRTLGRVALYLLLLGSLLFCGSLVLNAIAGVSSRLAPVGGISMMLGWVLWAVDALRR